MKEIDWKQGALDKLSGDVKEAREVALKWSDRANNMATWLIISVFVNVAFLLIALVVLIRR